MKRYTVVGKTRKGGPTVKKRSGLKLYDACKVAKAWMIDGLYVTREFSS